MILILKIIFCSDSFIFYHIQFFTPGRFLKNLISADSIWFISNFKRKILICTRILTSDLLISSLALYHLNYPGSVYSTGLNLSLESNAMQGVVVCDNNCHNLTHEITNLYIDI